MRAYNKEEFEQHEHTLKKELKKEVFIYPTDSIYGIGCDATNAELVQKVRDLKNSTTQPFSVIAPSKEWIHKYCEVEGEAKEWVDKLGRDIEIEGKKKAVSLVLPLKDKTAVAPNVLQGVKSLSVRMPNHWFTKVAGEIGIPIVTTSANPTGGNIMTSLEDLHEKIKNNVNICIYEGPIKGSPSTLIRLDKKNVDEE